VATTTETTTNVQPQETDSSTGELFTTAVWINDEAEWGKSTRWLRLKSAAQKISSWSRQKVLQKCLKCTLAVVNFFPYGQLSPIFHVRFDERINKIEKKLI